MFEFLCEGEKKTPAHTQNPETYEDDDNDDMTSSREK